MYIYVNVYMYIHICVCVLSHFSCVWFFSTLWTVVRQSPLSMRFSRQEYWSGSPCPPPGDLPNPEIQTASPGASALQVDSLPLSHRGSPYMCVYIYVNIYLCLYMYRERERELCQGRRCETQGFSPWIRKISWRRSWQPTPVFLPRESHGQRTLES